MRARAARLRLVTRLAACWWIVPVSAGAAPLQAFVTVTARELAGFTHVTPIGGFTLDPREWGGWNPAAFYPLVVIPATTSP